jgi:hypothetical protein
MSLATFDEGMEELTVLVYAFCDYARDIGSFPFGYKHALTEAIKYWNSDFTIVGTPSHLG